MPWQLTVGEDFCYPETNGKKAAGTNLINAYASKARLATQRDRVVYGAFLKVMNLMAPSTSLMRPDILWRVLRRGKQNRSA